MIDDDPVLRRRIARRQAEHRKQLIAAISGITGVLVLVCGVVWALANKRQGGSLGGGATTLLSSFTAPSASSEGNKWTHKELAEHLKSKGIEIHVIGATTMMGQPYSHWKRGEEVYPIGRDGQIGQLLAVVLMKTPQEAREAAGAHGEYGASWGRFVFYTNDKFSAPYLADVLKALN